MDFTNWWINESNMLGDFLNQAGWFIFQLIVAIIVFLIGWIIAIGVGKIVAEILSKIKFNQIFEKGGWKSALDKADIKVDPSEFIGSIFKWVLMIIALMLAADILGFSQFAGFLGKVVAWLPNVIIAALIFVAAVIIADIVEKIVKAGVEGMKVGYSNTIGSIVKWAIWVFAILAILQQLNIAIANWSFEIIKIAFTGIVLALALAFGLGGRDVAADILQDARKKLKG